MQKHYLHTILLILIILAACKDSDSLDTSFIVQNGQLKMEDHDLQNDGIVELSGEWAFYWMPETFEQPGPGIAEHMQSVPVVVPDVWNRNGIPGTGYAMYRLHVLLGRQYNQELALLFKGIGTSAEIYINNEKYASIGRIGITKEDVLPEQKTEIVRFVPNNKIVDIVVKVANFHHWQGGIWNPVYMGPADNLERFQNAGLFFDSFLSGILFLMFCYLIFYYFRNTYSIKTLYLAVFCFLFIIRVVFVGAGIANIFIPHLHRDIFVTITYVDLYLIIPFMVLYINAIFPKDAFDIANKASLIISALFIMSVFVFPSEISTRLMAYFQIVIILFIFVCGTVVVKAVKSQRFGAYIFLSGFIFLSLLALNEILISRHIINSIDSSILGIILFIVSQIIIITKEFSVLAVSKKEAEIAAETKSLFMANMSHEIRTPMNIVIGMNHLLEQTELNSQQQDYLKKSKIASEGLLSIINDILDISKIEAGKVDVESIELSIHEIINNQLSMFLPKANEKGLVFTSKIDKDIPFSLLGDPYRLNQILTNIVSNAIKFTQKGAIHIAVHILSDSEDGDLLLLFEVQDSGIGMSPEQQEHLFETFQQADSTTTRMYGGTGLGLAICKELTQLLMGHISVHSKLHEGTTFKIEIPFKRMAGNSESIIHSKVNESSTDLDSIKGASVLLVEDNVLNQQVASEIMSQKGLNVDVAENGKNALSALDKKKYDIVLMDIQMPVLDGYQSTVEIRKNKKYEHLPVIAMTAHTFKSTVDACFKAGMNDYISKPIEPEKLFKLLIKWLKPRVDLNGALKRIGGDKDFLIEILKQFIELYADTPSEFAGYLGKNDMEGLSNFAHTIRGMCANIGAIAVSEMADKIETAVNNRQIEVIPSLLKEFENEFKVAFDIVEKYIGEGYE